MESDQPKGKGKRTPSSQKASSKEILAKEPSAEHRRKVAGKIKFDQPWGDLSGQCLACDCGCYCSACDCGCTVRMEIEERLERLESLIEVKFGDIEKILKYIARSTEKS